MFACLLLHRTPSTLRWEWQNWDYIQMQWWVLELGKLANNRKFRQNLRIWGGWLVERTCSELRAKYLIRMSYWTHWSSCPKTSRRGCRLRRMRLRILGGWQLSARSIFCRGYRGGWVQVRMRNCWGGRHLRWCQLRLLGRKHRWRWWQPSEEW